MQSRTKVEQRRRFTKTEKLQMLAKSNSRCCHCGEILDIHSMSVEHAVPISHAGMNDERNLVALCKTCNPVKDDKVLTNAVPAYYKYLNLEPLLKLLEYVDEYCKTYKYFEWNNFTQEDDTLITPKNMPTAKQQIEDKEIIKILPKLILHKARYCDLDNIVDFYYKKLKDNGVSYDETIEAIYKNFLLGAIYCIQTPYNEIVGAFGVALVLDKADYIIINDIAYSDKYYRAMLISLNCITNNINENIKSKIYGIMFMSTAADRYTVIEGLIDGKHPKELTYFLPKAARDQGIRVWKVYYTKGGHVNQRLQQKVINVMTLNTKKELAQYQKDRSCYLSKILPYNKYDELMKNM